MKENVFDVLMYLFENYYMDEENPVTPDRESVQQELHNAGFPAPEIEQPVECLLDFGQLDVIFPEFRGITLGEIGS